jgi:hypothetical protein
VSGLRILESVHGHFGVLAAVALLHPALLLARGRPMSRGARWAVGLTAGVTAIAFSLGVAIYRDYRDFVRGPIFLRDPKVGLLFETKEHLAFAVIALTLAGALAAFVAPREEARIRRIAACMFGAAALLCFVTAGLGTYVASFGSF